MRILSNQRCKSLPIGTAARGVKDGTAFAVLKKRIDSLSDIIEQNGNQTSLENLEKIRNEIIREIKDIKRDVNVQVDELGAELVEDLNFK